MSTRRFLIIGGGSIGKRHLGNLQLLEAGHLMVFDPRADRRAEIEAKFQVETVANLEDAWKLDPHVALITAPTSLHLDLALQAAQHNCHLFIEKPLSHDMNGVAALIEQTQARGLISLVGCNMRFHPGVATVKRLIDQNTIGQIVSVRAEVGQYLPDWHPWEDYRQGYSARRALGGGVILDCIHEIDSIRWMLGEASTVACMAGTLSRLEIDTEDTASILIRFASNAIGDVHLDYVQRTANRECVAIGDEGTIRWTLASGEVRLFESRTKSWTSLPQPEGWQANQMYIDELKHFLDCLDNRTESTQPIAEGAKALAIALAAKTSVAERRFVDITEIWDLSRYL